MRRVITPALLAATSAASLILMLPAEAASSQGAQVISDHSCSEFNGFTFCADSHFVRD